MTALSFTTNNDVVFQENDISQLIFWWAIDCWSIVNVHPT